MPQSEVRRKVLTRHHKRWIQRQWKDVGTQGSREIQKSKRYWWKSLYMHEMFMRIVGGEPAAKRLRAEGSFF